MGFESNEPKFNSALVELVKNVLLSYVGEETNEDVHDFEAWLESPSGKEHLIGYIVERKSNLNEIGHHIGMGSLVLDYDIDQIQDKVRLSQGILQGYYAEQLMNQENITEEGEVLSEEEKERKRDKLVYQHGEAFRSWYKSEAGKKAVYEYAKNLDEADIIEMKGMDTLLSMYTNSLH